MVGSESLSELVSEVCNYFLGGIVSIGLLLHYKYCSESFEMIFFLIVLFVIGVLYSHCMCTVM